MGYWFFFLGSELEVLIGKFNVFDKFFMGIGRSESIDQKLIIDGVGILVLHVPGHDSKLKLPLFLNIEFKDTSEPGHEYPGSLEVVLVVIAKESDFGVELGELIVSF